MVGRSQQAPPINMQMHGRADGAAGGRLPLLGAVALVALPGVAVKQAINCVQLQIAAAALVARDRRSVAGAAGPGVDRGGRADGAAARHR
jgi:hypothetical protein